MIVRLALIPVLLAATLGCADGVGAQASPPTARRIVSLVPALTEMLFAIGAGPQVIAVSSYDDEPADVRRLPRVGALLDPDVERILSLRPDLVVTYGSQSDLQAQLTRAAIPFYDYRHGGLATVTATLRDLGARTGHEAGADRVAAGIERRLAAVRRRTAGRARAADAAGLRPRAWRAAQYLRQRRAWLPARDARAAGGDNVFADVDREAVQATTELVLARAPDVILEIRSADIRSDEEAAAGPAAGSPWPRCRPSEPARHRPHGTRPDRAGAASPRWSSGLNGFWGSEVLRFWGTCEGRRLVVVRQGLRLDAAPVARDAAWCDGGALHHHQRGLRPRGDARRATNAGRGAGPRRRAALHVVPLPWPCSNADYERLMAAAVAALVADGFTHMAFGDLFLEDVRRYREDRLAGTGLQPLFPLWRTADTVTLAREMIAGGLEARLTTVDPRALDRSFAGRAFDASLLADLPPEVDSCGERGEFHTFACAGPMFAHPIAVRTGAVVERDGFVFCDLEPATP